MNTALIETHYFPSILYFTALQKADTIIIERHEHFIKQTYRNRCYINTVQGKEMLNIPLSAKHGKILITDIRIDYNQRWLNNHWRTLQTAYGKAPFFEHYRDDIHLILFKKLDFLYDLNYNLLSLCLKWLRWDKKIEESSAYTPQYLVEKNLKDLRNSIIAKNYQVDKISLPYNQVFGNMFVPNLSLIDLIFCTGPAANHFITPHPSDD